MVKVLLCCLLGCVICINSIASDNVPVVIWSSERPLSDLPDAPASGSVSQHDFLSRYITPLMSDSTHSLVAFLQDKVSIEDISQYADVYNRHSVGGALKNVKSLLDENHSLELPNVDNPHYAIKKFKTIFNGSFYDLRPEDEITHMDFDVNNNFLLTVNLAPILGASDVAAAIASNDDLVGTVVRHLAKKNVKFSSLYTGETSQKIEGNRMALSRHLLEAPDDTVVGTFFNVTYGNSSLYAYLRSFNACVLFGYDKANPPSMCSDDFSVSGQDLGKSSKLHVSSDVNYLFATISLSNVKTNMTVYNLNLTIPFRWEYDRWKMLTARLNMTNSTHTVVSNVSMTTQDLDLVFSIHYSFHCSVMEFSPVKLSSVPIVYIVLGGFQIQPYNMQGYKFLPSQDCVGWFSTAIWMSLFSIGLHVIILFFAILMISNLSTYDRFDDPKGKTLTICLAE